MVQEKLIQGQLMLEEGPAGAAALVLVSCKPNSMILVRFPNRLAHSCTRFPCYLGMEIQHRVVTSYMGGNITNGALGAQISQIECGFWQISPANINSGLENKKIPPKKHFLGCKKGQFFWVFTNFRKWRLLIASNPHFREFASCRLPPSADRVPTMFTNFRK